MQLIIVPQTSAPAKAETHWRGASTNGELLLGNRVFASSHVDELAGELRQVHINRSSQGVWCVHAKRWAGKLRRHPSPANEKESVCSVLSWLARCETAFEKLVLRIRQRCDLSLLLFIISL